MELELPARKLIPVSRIHPLAAFTLGSARPVDEDGNVVEPDQLLLMFVMKAPRSTLSRSSPSQ